MSAATSSKQPPSPPPGDVTRPASSTGDASSGNVLSSSLLQINDLDDGLLFEILHHLDCKSATLCKSVSKRWLSLISTPFFLHCFVSNRRRFPHLYPQQTPFTLVLQFSDMYRCDFDVRLLPFENQIESFSSDVDPFAESPPSPCWVLKSLSGFRDSSYLVESPIWKSFKQKICFKASFEDLLLFYCCRWEKDRSGYSGLHDFYICNPLTRQWDSLRLLSSSKIVSECVAGLVCEGCNVTEPDSYRYRVVLIYHPAESETQFEVDIYVSETREWMTSVPVSGIHPMDRLRRDYQWFSDTVAWKGMLHWVHQGEYLATVVSFDPFLRNGGECRLIGGPNGADWFSGFLSYIGLCRDSLRVFQCRDQLDFWSVCIWDLEDVDYGSKSSPCSAVWSMKIKVTLTEVVSRNREFSELIDENALVKYMKVVGFHPYDADVVFLQIRRGILQWNLETGIMRAVNSGIHSVDSLRVFVLVHQPWPALLRRSFLSTDMQMFQTVSKNSRWKTTLAVTDSLQGQ